MAKFAKILKFLRHWYSWIFQVQILYGSKLNEEFSNDALEAHNNYRYLHNASKLKLNKEISKIAQKLADKLAQNEELKHSKSEYDGKRLGENLAMLTERKGQNSG